MKLIVLSLLMTTGALASYYQSTCSNSDGSVKYHNGHSMNGVEVKKFDRQTGSEVSSTLYPLANSVVGGQSAKVEIKKLKTINIEEEENCTSSGSGMYERTEISSNSIKIFLIADHLKIEDFFICKYYINSRTNCN